MEILGFTAVPAITVICYLVGEAVKASGLDNKYIPLICGLAGLHWALAAMFIMPSFPALFSDIGCYWGCIRACRYWCKSDNQTAYRQINKKAAPFRGGFCFCLKCAIMFLTGSPAPLQRKCPSGEHSPSGVFRAQGAFLISFRF